MTSGSQSAASGSSTIAVTSASWGTSVGRATSVPTNGSSSKLLTGIQTGSSVPAMRTSPGGSPTSSHASRSAAASGPASVASTAPPGQGDLAGVGAQVAVPNGERHDEVAVSVGVDRQQGRRRARRRELATLESAPGGLPVGGARQESIVEGNRAFGRLDGTTQHVLPAGLLA